MIQILMMRLNVQFNKTLNWIFIKETCLNYI